MKRKSHSTPPDDITETSPSSRKKDAHDLTDIRQKLMNANALNGGFDRLLFQIDRIEEGQTHLSKKVDKIHDAIYDPSEGIFARLNADKSLLSSQLSTVSRDVESMQSWREKKDKVEEECKTSHDVTSEKMTKIETVVNDLVESKKSMWALFKWVGVALAGDMITLFFAWLQTKLNIKQ